MPNLQFLKLEIPSQSRNNYIHFLFSFACQSYTFLSSIKTKIFKNMWANNKRTIKALRSKGSNLLIIIKRFIQNSSEENIYMQYAIFKSNNKRFSNSPLRTNLSL